MKPYLGLAVLALTIAPLAPKALAQSIKLRCDPTATTTTSTGSDRPPPLVVLINTSLKTAHEGEDDNVGWYYDGTSFTDTESDDASKPNSAPGEEDGHTHCDYKVNDFFRTTDDRVEFGMDYAPLKPCGFNGLLSASEIVETYSIDRWTGIMTYTEQVKSDGTNVSGPTRYQCQLIKDRLF